MSVRRSTKKSETIILRIPRELLDRIQAMNWDRVNIAEYIVALIEEGLRTKIDRIRNPIKYFAEECTKAKRGNIVSKKTVYDHFLRYIEKHWGHSCTQAGFSRRFRQYAPAGVSETRIRKDGRRIRAWQNIVLIDDQ